MTSSRHPELISGSQEMLKLVQHDESIKIFNHCRDGNPDLRYKHFRHSEPKATESSFWINHRLDCFARPADSGNGTRNDNRKIAFTLAEVLITLGIIGVVAALTMPVLIANYQEKATVTKVKKFYSTFSQAYLMAVNDHGTIDNWGLTNSETIEDEDGNTTHSDESFANYEKFLDIMEPYMQRVSRDTIKNGSIKKDTKGYVFADGTAIVGMWLSPENCNESNPNSSCGDLYFNTDSKTKTHVNGKLNYNKKIFGFDIKPNKISLRGNTDILFNFCKNGENYAQCTAWVVINGNMDYLHCPDKLGWDKARSCK